MGQTDGRTDRRTVRTSLKCPPWGRGIITESLKKVIKTFVQCKITHFCILYRSLCFLCHNSTMLRCPSVLNNAIIDAKCKNTSYVCSNDFCNKKRWKEILLNFKKRRKNVTIKT